MKTICRSNHYIGGIEYYLYTQTLKTERIPISDIEIREINYFECIVLSMCGYDDDLSAFLDGFGFTEEELCAVIDELNSYRSIPGTTIGRYMNRVINALTEEERTAFLKGIIVGVAIRKAADALAEPDLTDEEKRIDHEIEKLRYEER